MPLTKKKRKAKLKEGAQEIIAPPPEPPPVEVASGDGSIATITTTTTTTTTPSSPISSAHTLTLEGAVITPPLPQTGSVIGISQPTAAKTTTTTTARRPSTLPAVIEEEESSSKKRQIDGETEELRTSEVKSTGKAKEECQGKAKVPTSIGTAKFMPNTPVLAQKPSGASPVATTTRTLISSQLVGGRLLTPTVTRTTEWMNKDEEEAISPEQQFYYLRLMAKPGRLKPEPIKMKFVRWAPTEGGQHRASGVEDEGQLDSQAMRVVRTIGQAFEVCHKMAQEQMQEKQQLEDIEESGNPAAVAAGSSSARVKRQSGASGTSDEEVRFGATAQKQQQLGGEEGGNDSRGSSPPAGSKRTSIFIPRRYSEASAHSQEAAVDTAARAAAAAAATLSFQQSQQQRPPLSPSIAMIIPSNYAEANPAAAAATDLHVNIPGSMRAATTMPQVADQQQRVAVAQLPTQQPLPFASNTLPHSFTWGQQQQQAGGGAASVYPSTATAGYPPPLGASGLYPMTPGFVASAAPPSSISMPFGLATGASPIMVSPYATLQLPPTSMNTSPASSGQPGNSMTAATASSLPDVAAALQLNRTLDQYNQQLIRSQLDQAQQSAQVASCQVQLLRDQLTSETTARLEAQSRTHQLLNTNRELLEQVQTLVGRLQHLEVRLTHEIGTVPIPPHYQLPPTGSSALPPRVPAAEAKVPVSPPILYPQRPYQARALADLLGRAGSLPPAVEATSTGGTGDSSTAGLPSAGDRRMAYGAGLSKLVAAAEREAAGAHTEPEELTSVAEDTTEDDFSASEQVEKTGADVARRRNLPMLGPLLGMEGPTTGTKQLTNAAGLPSYNILLSNPQAAASSRAESGRAAVVPSFFQAINLPPRPSRGTPPRPPLTSTYHPAASQPAQQQQQSKLATEPALQLAPSQPLRPTPLFPLTTRLIQQQQEQAALNPQPPQPPKHAVPMPTMVVQQQRREEVVTTPPPPPPLPPLPPAFVAGMVATTTTPVTATPPTSLSPPKSKSSHSRRYSLQPGAQQQRGAPVEDASGAAVETGSVESAGTPPRAKKSSSGGKGVFGDVGFSRMSFNPRLNVPGKKTDSGLINVPSPIAEEDDGTGRRKSRSTLGGSDSPRRRRSSLGLGGQAVPETDSPRRSINAPAASSVLGLGTKQLERLGKMANAAIVRQRKEAAADAAKEKPHKSSPETIRKGGFQTLAVELEESPPTTVIISSALRTTLANSTASTAGQQPTTGDATPPRVKRVDVTTAASSHHHHHQQLGDGTVLPNSPATAAATVTFNPSQRFVGPTPSSEKLPRRKLTDVTSMTRATQLALQNAALTQQHQGSGKRRALDDNSNPLLLATTSALVGSGQRLPDPDSVKGRTLQALEAQRLGDPAILAKLTSRTFQNAGGAGVQQPHQHQSYHRQRQDNEGSIAPILPNGLP